MRNTPPVSNSSKLLCTCTAAWLLTLGQAVGADLSVAPIYDTPAAATWSGAYIGSAGGGGWGSAVVPNAIAGIDLMPKFDSKNAPSGITSGIQFQSGSWVLGYEADISIAGRKDGGLEFPSSTGFSNEVRERWLSTFRGRVGLTQNDWLLYATAGGALANVQQSITSPAGASFAENQWHWGWTVGAGLELKLGQDWSAKMEYLFVALQDKVYFKPASSPAFASNQQVRSDDHAVRVGVNYKLPWNVLDNFFKR